MQKLSSSTLLISLRGIAVAAVGALAFTGSPAYALTATIWGNSFGSGGPVLQEWDQSGNLLDTITAPLGVSGRGVVQLGNILYYTSATTNGVYAYDFSTNTNLGTVFTVAGASGLSSMAYDGTNFWIGDYSGTNHAYLYSPTGTLLNTISFANCSSFCDGLEFANGKLISNRFDGGFGGTNFYDVYSTSGTLLTSAFITGHDSSGNTGIAFDGTDYYVSNIASHTISVYDSNGNWLRDITLDMGTNLGGVEDLSVNYALVLNPPVPLPGALPLFATGLVGLGLLGWRRKKKAAA
jgi:hypothetical protein